MIRSRIPFPIFDSDSAKLGEKSNPMSYLTPHLHRLPIAVAQQCGFVAKFLLPGTQILQLIESQRYGMRVGKADVGTEQEQQEHRGQQAQGEQTGE